MWIAAAYAIVRGSLLLWLKSYTRSLTLQEVGAMIDEAALMVAPMDLERAFCYHPSMLMGHGGS